MKQKLIFILTIWFVIAGFVTWFIIVKPFIIGMKFADKYLEKITN